MRRTVIVDPTDPPDSTGQRSTNVPRQSLPQTFLILEGHRRSLMVQLNAYLPWRRYEDLCLATAICRVQHHLVCTAESGWIRSDVRSCLRAGTELDLQRHAHALARCRRL